MTTHASTVIDYLMFTDSAEAALCPVPHGAGLFVCFDRECAANLEQVLPGRVRVPPDYGIRVFSTFEELYSHDMLPGETASATRTPESHAYVELGECAVRDKSVEAYALILHVWDIVDTACRHERPLATEVRIRDDWLSLVVRARLQSSQ